MPKLLQADQMRFITGRQTSDATRQLLNIIHHSEQSQMLFLLLSIGVEKSFDRVHLGYMCQVLDQFGFCGPILLAILALYSAPSAQVFTFSFLSKPSHITNSTR